MQAPGPMIDMQIRVRGKEAKRKNIDAVNTANKKRCEREERIAIAQLKAYWDLFPEADKEERAKNTPAPETDDDELIEDTRCGKVEKLRPARLRTLGQPNGNGGQYDDVMSDVCNPQGIRSPRRDQIKDSWGCPAPCCVFPGAVVFLDLAQQFAGYPATLNCQTNPPEGSEFNDQELIEEVATYHDKSYTRMMARNARLELRKTLQASIEDKQEAEAKKRKLDPPNSRDVTDPSAINRDVDQTQKDPLQVRIQQRSSTKRGCLFNGTSLGCKTTKREAQAILNICSAGKPRIEDPDA